MPTKATAWLVPLLFLLASQIYIHRITLLWCFAQSLDVKLLEEWTWNQWKNDGDVSSRIQDIPTIDFRAFETVEKLLVYMKETHGQKWRDKPLLMRNVWNATELRRPDRNLSLGGLLKLEQEIPYFWDARQFRLTPDSTGSVSGIVGNLTQSTDAHHKIGSQLPVEHHPDWIVQVAPVKWMRELFGPFFTAWHVRNRITTVPLFVGRSQAEKESSTSFTALHCEPIANVAVQLHGSKRWTLVEPRWWHHLKPSLSPDRRAFVYSRAATIQVPHYSVVTRAGDALWLPTWAWHRVDYATDDDAESISIAASLFHFRPLSFVRNNPVFFSMILPAVFREAVGWQTQ